MKEKLNTVVMKAQKGCEESLNALYKYFLPIIERESLRIWHRVHDETTFEKICIRILKQEIARFDPGKSDFRNYMLRKIFSTRNQLLKHRRREISYHSFSIEALAGRDGEQETFEIKDVLADVEQEVLLKEKVALLAEGDPRKLAVLNAWMTGCDNYSEISRMLAHTFGGKPESHRKFVQRFKTDCQSALSAS